MAILAAVHHLTHYRYDRPVTDVRLTYAGETHSLVARFAPSGG